MIIWFLCLTITIFGLYKTGPVGKFFNLIPPKFFAFFTWIVYLLYFIFPKKHYFNGNFRFCFKTFAHILISPFKTLSFFISFCTYQILSFVIPFRDLCFSICYTSKLLSKSNNYETCHNTSTIKILSIVLVMIFLIIKLIQNLKQSIKLKNKNGKRLFSMLSVEMILFILTLMISIISAFSTFTHIMNPIWIVFVTLATIFSFICDLKELFAFLYPKEGISNL